MGINRSLFRRILAGNFAGKFRRYGLATAAVAAAFLISSALHPLVEDRVGYVSTLLQRFACARLSRPCLPRSCPGVSATLTTTAFARSSLRWLEIGS